MSSTKWDVAVIGAGPAGSAAAYACASLGLRTLIVEKASFPRDKVCGGCLSPSGMSSLRQMGLEQSVRRVSSPIRSFSLAARNRVLRVDLDDQGAAIGRDVLDVMLLDHAIARGAIAQRNATGSLIESSEQGCRLSISRCGFTEEVAAGVVVVADGLAGSFLPRDSHWESRLARRSYFGVAARIAPGDANGLCDPGTIAMRCGGAGYFGAVALHDGSIDVAAALCPEKTKQLGGPGAAIRQVALQSGASEHVDLLAETRWRGTPLLTRRRNVEAAGIFVAGDAAGYVEPFTGEGMSWGLAAGLAVARHVKAALAQEYRAGEWTRGWRLLAERRRAACRATAIALRSPTLIAASISLANAIPAVANVFSSAISGPWRFGGSEPVRA